MKTVMSIVVICWSAVCFGQHFSKDDHIQNFYMACGADKRSTQDMEAGVELIETDDFARAKERFARAYERDNSNCNALYMLAYCFQREYRLDTALVLCDKSIALEEVNPSAWNIKGTTLLLKGDTLGALSCYEKGKRYNPEQIDGYYNLALLYYLMRRYDESAAMIEEYEKLPKASVLRRDERMMRDLWLKLPVTRNER